MNRPRLCFFILPNITKIIQQEDGEMFLIKDIQSKLSFKYEFKIIYVELKENEILKIVEKCNEDDQLLYWQHKDNIDSGLSPKPLVLKLDTDY